MARHRLKKAKVTRQRVEPVLIPSRRMVVWNADLTTKESRTRVVATVPPRNEELEGALVRPVVKYHEGDEERAQQVEKSMVEHAKNFAAHVYHPERVVVKIPRAKMPGMLPTLLPMDAVKMWMRERPPKVVGKDDVLKVVRKYLRDVPAGAFDREEPVPFILKWVSGQDFGPFRGGFSVGPLDKGVYSVSARYEGRAGRSNRAGKTALVSVVRQACYGDLRKGRDQAKLIHGEADKAVAVVHLVGPAGEVLLQIGRWVSRSGSGAVVDGDKYSTTTASEEFARRVRLKRDDFVKTCFIGEGDLHGVLGQTAAPIMEDMTRWMGLSGWTYVCKATTAELVLLVDEMKKLEAVMAVHLARAEEGCPDGEAVVAQRRVVAELSEVAKRGEERRTAVRDLKARLEKAERVQEALENARGGVALRKRLKVLRRAKDACKTALVEPIERMSVLKAEIAKCEEALAGFDGECPVDGAKCPRADQINKNDSMLEKKLGRLKKERDGMKVVLLKLENDLDHAEGEFEGVVGALRRVADAEDYLEKHGRKPEDAVVLKRRLTMLEGESVSRKDLEEAQDKMAGMLADIKAVERSKADAAKLASRLEEMEGQVRLLRYVRMMTGRQGIPLMQVQNASQTVEADANRVMAMMGTEHRLEFVFEKPIKSRKEFICGGCGREYRDGEHRCQACGTERGVAVEESFVPMVRDGARVQAFDQDSSGGKSMLALAMRIALARFLGVALLVIDEADKSLDDYSLGMFVSLLPRLSEMGFAQVFVISHRPQVAEAIANRIEVVRFLDEQRSEVVLLP